VIAETGRVITVVIGSKTDCRPCETLDSDISGRERLHQSLVRISEHCEMKPITRRIPSLRRSHDLSRSYTDSRKL